MTIIETYHRITSGAFADEDGEPVTMTGLPPPSPADIQRFEQTFHLTLDADVRALLAVSGGIEGGPLASLDFLPKQGQWAPDIDFSPGLSVLGTDGFGNYWVYDTPQLRGCLGPIYYFCHDAPIWLYQSASLADFLLALEQMCSDPKRPNAIDDVHEDRPKSVWRTNPDLLDLDAAIRSSDPVISSFAAGKPATTKIIDLRAPQIGDGFSWGRCSMVERHPQHPIFALQFRRGLLERITSKLLGRGRPHQ